MNPVAMVMVVVLAIFAAAVLGAWLRGGGGPQTEVKGIREDMQRLLATQAQGFAAQMGQVTQLVTQQLGEVRRDLENGVTTAGKITADAQRDVTEQLRTSAEALTRLNQHLGAVQESGRELTEAAKSMQAALGKPISPGVWGQAQLHDLLADVLPPSSYEFAHRFASGATASAVLHAGRKLVAIDADFPLDAYRQVTEKGEEARSEFAQAVREQVDRIAESLVLPQEGTLDLALMFVPSESAFLELLRTEDGGGRLDEYCRQKHVLPVSPSSLHAYLSAVLMGARETEFEENVKRLRASLETVKERFHDFGAAYQAVGVQIDEATRAHEVAGRRLAETQEALAVLGSDETAEAVDSALPQAAEVPVAVKASKNGA